MSDSTDQPGAGDEARWPSSPPPPPPPRSGSATPGPPGGDAPSGEGSEQARGVTATGEATIARLKARGSWSVWDLAAGAILLAFTLSWISGVFESFRHDPGADSQYRVLVFFSPGSVPWAVAVIVALALVATGQRFEVPKASEDASRHALVLGLAAAGGVIGVSAAIDLLVELTNFGHGIDDALVGIITYLAVLPMAVVACLWANALRSGPRPH